MFLVHKKVSKFGYDPKERDDYILLKRLGPKESHGTIIGNVLGLMRFMCRKREMCLFLSIREYVGCQVGWFIDSAISGKLRIARFLFLLSEICLIF